MTIALDQPEPVVEKSSFVETTGSLKDRIKAHYDICSTYYLSLWGQHIHHGYWTEETDKITKETAQIHLIELLLNRAGLPCTSETAKRLGLPTELHSTTTSASSPDRKLRVLDVGCGVGGTTRYLAQQREFEVTGITLSSEQVKIATQLTRDAGGVKIEVDAEKVGKGEQANFKLGEGSVRFIQLDAEKMGDHFDLNSFDIVWISEALSHLPNKELFFRSSSNLLKAGGKLVIADWLKKPDLTEDEFKADIEPIEVGMLLPPLDTMDGYLQKGRENALEVRKGGEPMDIGDQVKRTWDISLSLIQSPSLWAFAISQGRDVIAFLKAFGAMRRGFGNGRFRYGVVVFEKRVSTSKARRREGVLGRTGR